MGRRGWGLTSLLTVAILAAILMEPNVSTAPARTQAAPTVVQERPCHGDAARCGRVKVPLDRANPASRRIGIAYELFGRRDRTRPSLGTIVAVEGGPGYSTTASRSYYLDLFDPLLDRHQLLLVDNRGTGKSGPIRCGHLQSYRGNRTLAIGQCGRKLGAKSDLYGSAIATDDMVAVLDRLGIGRIHLYGDSYGTFFAQTFALRHGDRLRTLILDAAYPVDAKSPWYADTNRSLRHAFSVACRRSPACAHRPGESMRRIARLTQALRHHPMFGWAPNADGEVLRTRVTVDTLIDILTGAATTPTIYRELDAAARAALGPRRYTLPLLRLAQETKYVGGAGPAEAYSEGLYAAVACNDYPQAYDVTARITTRYNQYRAATRNLQRQRPGLFAPFTVREWVTSPYGYFDECLRWPRPSRWVRPVPRNPQYPDVPTLVLAGDLDSLTSPEGARATADAFPNSTLVVAANTTHVSALIDFDKCASKLVVRFVRTSSARDFSCARDYHENRLVDQFVRLADETGWKGPRKTVRITAATLADVMARWWSMYGYEGVGLQGGTFTTRGGSFTHDRPVVTWRLSKVRWVKDVAVSGVMTWHRRSGRVAAEVTVIGAGTKPARLKLRWNDLAPHARAVARGTVGGEHVRIQFPAS